MKYLLGYILKESNKNVHFPIGTVINVTFEKLISDLISGGNQK